MTLRTLAKRAANALLKPANAQIESLTVHTLEGARLQKLAETGQFERPIFNVPESFASLDCSALLARVAMHDARFADLDDASNNEVGFTFSNGYFTSPDAEVLYSIVREVRPVTVVEVGSGNSTKLFRLAILDGKLRTKIVSIDPLPRTEIAEVSDTVVRRPVEELNPVELANSLQPNDILFIDSSHQVKPGNDVAFLFLQVLPRLQPGVLVHVHDIFTPYEYPKEWIVDHRWPWNEQYLVQVLLDFSDRFDVLWAGHFLQRTRSDFVGFFPRSKGRIASSLWLRTRYGKPKGRGSHAK
jgi:hypothetical protein